MRARQQIPDNEWANEPAEISYRVDEGPIEQRRLTRRNSVGIGQKLGGSRNCAPPTPTKSSIERRTLDPMWIATKETFRSAEEESPRANGVHEFDQVPTIELLNQESGDVGQGS